MPLDARNYYLIRATNGQSVMCRRGDGAPKLISGGARYNVVNRARRKSTVEWDGDDPYRMDLTVLLDGWLSQTSIESDVSKLNQMRQSPGDLTPPVQVFIDGAVPVKGAKWVVENIDWGDMVLWTTDSKGAGYRLRQDAVLHMLQYVEATMLKVAVPGTGFPIVLKAEQTLTKIAKDFNVAVQDIMKANNVRDSKSIKTGQHLIVPGNLFNLPIKPQLASVKPPDPKPKPQPARTPRSIGITSVPGLVPPIRGG